MLAAGCAPCRTARESTSNAAWRSGDCRQRCGEARLSLELPLPTEFFARPTLQVARELLGARLVHDGSTGRRVGRVVETEAYVGLDDRGSHAYRGPTARTAVMFGPPGVAYVYLIYGLHNCLNVVTEAEGFPSAVLLRAIEPVEGLAGPARGPGLLCRAMEIDRTHNGVGLTAPPLFFLPPEAPHVGRPVAAGPRVGIDYAGDSADLPWRFWLADSAAVSRARSPGSGHRRRAGRPPPPQPP